MKLTAFFAIFLGAVGSASAAHDAFYFNTGIVYMNTTTLVTEARSRDVAATCFRLGALNGFVQELASSHRDAVVVTNRVSAEQGALVEKIGRLHLDLRYFCGSSFPGTRPATAVSVRRWASLDLPLAEFAIAARELFEIEEGRQESSR